MKNEKKFAFKFGRSVIKDVLIVDTSFFCPKFFSKTHFNNLKIENIK